jgi:hypothetical protein
MTMLQNELLTQEEFEILANLSENIQDKTVLELISRITADNFKDRDIIDCILEKQYKTALEIIG